MDKASEESVEVGDAKVEGEAVVDAEGLSENIFGEPACTNGLEYGILSEGCG